MRTLFSCLLISLSVNAYALDCSSVGTFSCATNEGLCFEYTPSETMAEAQFKSYCNIFEGTFSASGCENKFNVGTCLVESNPMMSITRFDENFDQEAAEIFCSSMSGEFCK